MKRKPNQEDLERLLLLVETMADTMEDHIPSLEFYCGPNFQAVRDLVQTAKETVKNFKND